MLQEFKLEGERGGGEAEVGRVEPQQRRPPDVRADDGFSRGDGLACDGVASVIEAFSAWQDFPYSSCPDVIRASISFEGWIMGLASTKSAVADLAYRICRSRVDSRSTARPGNDARAS